MADTFSSMASYGSTNPLAEKQATVSAKTTQKQGKVADAETLKAVAIGVMNENEFAQDQHIQDLENLSDADYILKYGFGSLEDRNRYRAIKMEIRQDMSAARRPGEIARDTAIDVVNTAANLAGGLASLGLSGYDVVAGRPISQLSEWTTGRRLGDTSPIISGLVHDFAAYMAKQKSAPFRAKADIHAYRTVFDEEEREERLEERRAAVEDNPDWFQREATPVMETWAEGFADTLDNYADHPTVASKLIPEGIASVGGIKLGMTVSARLLKTTQARTALGSVAASETGGAVTEAQQTVLSMPIEELKDDPGYKALEAEGLSEGEIRNRLAGDAGFIAAAVGLPVTAVASKLSLDFAKAPLTTGGKGLRGKTAGALKNTGSETLEEASQNTIAGLASDIGQAGAGLDVEIGKDVGVNVAEGALSGSLTAGTLQGPGVVAKGTFNAARQVGKAGATVAKVGSGVVGDVVGAGVEAAADIGRSVKASRETKRHEARMQEASEATAILQKSLGSETPAPEDASSESGHTTPQRPGKTILDEVAKAFLITPEEAGQLAEEHDGIVRWLENAPGTPLNRQEVVELVGESFNRAKSPSEKLMHALTIVSSLQDLEATDSDAIREGTAALDDADPDKQSLLDIQERIDATRSSQAAEAARNYLENLTKETFGQATSEIAEIQGVSQEDVATDMTEILAAYNYGVVSEEIANKALNQSSAGDGGGRTIKTLQGLKQLVDSAAILEKEKARIEAQQAAQIEAIQDPEKKNLERSRAHKTSDIVRQQIHTEGNADNRAPSLVEHNRRVAVPLRSGKIAEAAEAMGQLRGFAQSQINKYRAMRKSAKEGKAQTYQAWNPAKEEFFESDSTVTFHKNSPGSLALARDIAADTQATVSLYNTLLETHGEALGMDSDLLNKSRLEVPELTAKLETKEQSEDKTDEQQRSGSRQSPEKGVPANTNKKKAPGPKPAESDSGQDDAATGRSDNRTEPETHPRLLSMAGARKRANRLFASFRVKKKARLLDHESPATFILENLSQLKEVAASKLDAPLTGKQDAALRVLLGEDLPKIRKAIEKLLKDAAAKNKSLVKNIREDYEFAFSSKNTLALNFLREVEGQEGKLEFDPAVVDAAVMAGFSWLIRQGSSGARPLKDRHIARAFGINEGDVTAQHRRAYQNGPRHHEIISAIARDLEEMLGLQQRKDITTSLSQGITRSMAATVLAAMKEARVLNVVEFGVPRVIYDAEGKRTKSETDETYLAVRPFWKGDRIEVDGKTYTVTDASVEKYQEIFRDLAPIADIFKMVFVENAKKDIEFEGPRKESPRTILRNPFRALRSKEKKAIESQDRQGYTLNMPMMLLRTALGRRHYLALNGYKDLEDGKFNKNDRESVQGKNISLDHGWDGVQAYIDGAIGYMTAAGLNRLDQVKTYFTHEISSVGRIQQYGRLTPQGDKHMREMWMATHSQIDLSDETHLKAFWLAVAQNLDLSVEKMYPHKAVNAAEELIESPALKPAVEMLENLLDRQEKNPDAVIKWSLEERDAFATILEDSGVKITDKAFHALMAVAGFNRANASGKSTFETALSFEADGKTDGPINAMMHLSRGSFEPHWIRVMAKGGLFFGKNPISLNDWIEAGKSSEFSWGDDKDLYNEGSAKVEEYTAEHLNNVARSEAGPAVGHILKVMDTLLAEFSYTERDEETKKGRLDIGRGVIKNPLTIFIYGSGLKGVSTKLAKQMTDEFYTQLSDILQKRATGEIARLEEHPLFRNEGFLRSFEWLLNNEVRSYKGKLYIKQGTNSVNLQTMMKNMEDADIPPAAFRTLAANVEMLFGQPLWKGVDAATGGLQKNMQFIQEASQLQTMIFQKVFQHEVKKLHAQRVREGKLSNSQLLSEKDYYVAMQKAMKTAPIYGTDAQEFHISGGESADSSSYVATSIDGKYKTGAVVPTASDASVKVSPYMTIGTGDGRMILNIYTDGSVDMSGTLPVFDGVELPLHKMFEASEHINKQVLEAWMGVNAFEAMAESLERTLPNLDRNIVEAVAREYADRFPRGKLPVSVEGFQGITLEMRQMANESRARKYAISKMQLSVDHMAGAGKPFHQEGEVVSDENALVERLNYHYEKELDRLNREKAREDRRPVQEGNKKKIKERLSETGFPNEEFGTVKVSGRAIFGMLLGGKDIPFNQEQRKTVEAVIGQLGKHVLEDVVFHFGTQAQLNALRKAEYGHLTGPLGRGVYYHKDKVAFISSRSAETILHEVLHAYTAEALGQFYSNRDAAPAHIREAIARLESLMGDFMQMDFAGESPNRRKVAQALQRELAGFDLNTDASQELRNYQKMSEFLSWMLSNQHLLDVGKQQKVYSPLVRWAHKVMAAIQNLLGIKGRPGHTMLSNIRFNLKVVAAPYNQKTVNSFADIGLNQSDVNTTHTSQARIETIGRRYLDRINAYLKSGWDVASTEARKEEIYRNRQQAKHAAHHAHVRGFAMTTAERQTFKAIHAVLASSMRLSPSAMSQANKIYAAAVKHMKATDFEQPGDYLARKRYEFLLGSGEDSLRTLADGRSDLLATFFALAQVNDQFREILENVPPPKDLPKGEKSVDGILTATAETAMNLITRFTISRAKQPKSIVQRLDLLAHTLAEVQGENRIIETSRKMRVLDPMNDRLASGIENVSKKVTAFLDKKAEKTTGRTQALLKGTSLVTGFFNKDDAEAQGESLTRMLNQLENDWHEVRALVSDVRNMTASNALILRMVSPVKAKIDALRQDSREKIPDYLAKQFSRKLTKAEWKALFDGIGRADLLALGKRAALEMLRDPDQVSQKILDVEERLASLSPDLANLYKEKAQALAIYMITGEVTSENLLRNAHAIARLPGEVLPAGTKPQVTAPLIGTIDHLTSYYAFRLLDGQTRETLKKLYMTEEKGVAFISGFHESTRKLEDQKLEDAETADDVRMNGWKGYVPSVIQEGVSLVVRNDSEAEDLELRGYTRLRTYKGDENENRRGRMGYYFSPVSGKNAYRQGVAQTVHALWRGVDIRTGQSRTGATADLITRKGAKRIQAAIGRPRNGLPAAERLLPIYDKDGVVMAYERSLEPSMVESLERDTHLGRMLGVWTGRILEERASDSFNRELVENTKKVWDEHARNGDADQFVNVAKSEDPVIKDAWNTLGWKIKKDIAEVFGDKNTFMVRRDLVEQTIGYRAYSITDPWTGMSRLKPEHAEAIRDAIVGMFGVNTFKRLKQFENGLTDMVSYAKTSIVVRSIIVAVDNIISNVWHMLIHGIDPITLSRGMRDKFIEISQYTANLDRIAELEAEYAADYTNTGKALKIKAEIQALVDSSKALSIWPLIDAGEFSTISESLTESDLAIREGKFSEYMEKAVEKLDDFMPGALADGLKTVGKNFLITKDTALFKGLNRMVQYGDFVSKAVIYDHLTREKGQSHEAVMDVISEEFVNYNRLAGRGRDYLESIGLMWFYNYKLRILKIAMKILRDRPASALFWSGGLAPILDIDTVMSGHVPAVIADGSVDYSLGYGMGWNALTGDMNPWLNLMR